MKPPVHAALSWRDALPWGVFFVFLFVLFFPSHVIFWSFFPFSPSNSAVILKQQDATFPPFVAPLSAQCHFYTTSLHCCAVIFFITPLITVWKLLRSMPMLPAVPALAMLGLRFGVGFLSCGTGTLWDRNTTGDKLKVRKTVVSFFQWDKRGLVLSHLTIGKQPEGCLFVWLCSEQYFHQRNRIFLHVHTEELFFCLKIISLLF